MYLAVYVFMWFTLKTSDRAPAPWNPWEGLGEYLCFHGLALPCCQLDQ